MPQRCDGALRVASAPPQGAVLVFRRNTVVDERSGWSAALEPDAVHWLDDRQRAGDTWVPTSYLGDGLIGLVHLEWTEDDEPAPVVPMRGVPIFPRRKMSKLAHDRLFERGKDLDVVELGGGQYAVESHSEPGRWHQVVVEERDGYLATVCSCRSSRYRPRSRSLACSHAAAVLGRICGTQRDDGGGGST